MTWTTNKPTKPGQYWCQMRDMRPRVVEVVEATDSHRLTIAQTETYIADLEPEHYRWAGPLEPPPMNPPQLTWTTDKPKAPGWFWYREPGLNGDKPMTAWVFDSHKLFYAHLCAVHQEPVVRQMNHCAGEWAGPMEPPPR